ncbi:MAG: divergent polysaccharide deacetylase family protein [Fibrobacter sp.]|nr:divergent polysaccharide deacetylase family protein [Fibrobacter sp.]
MKKTKHIIAIIIVLVIIIGTAVVLLPKLADSELAKSLTQEGETSTEQVVEEVAADTIPFKDKLQEELQVVQSTYAKRKKKDVWTLGRGQSIITYLLQTQRFVAKKGGKILYMEELHNNNVLQSANVEILQPDNDTLCIEFQVSESVFRDDASVLAVAFQVTKLTPELIVELNKLDYPYSLLIPPFGTQSDFYPNLDKVNSAELELWLTLESTKLDKSHNKLRPLRIHHTEEQIENVVDEAKTLIPRAKGVVSRFGEQAVEHEQLLQAILKPVQKNNLWFIDATMNSRSKVPQACKNLNLKCEASSYYNPDNSALADYVKQRLRDARRRGLSTMFIPLTTDNLNKVKDLSEKAKNQGTSLVYLSKFMEY